VKLPAQQQVVNNFLQTHEINSEGRYAVELPRVKDTPLLGEYRTKAVQRFLQNERSLKRKGSLTNFEKVLDEYIELGHTDKVPQSEVFKQLSKVYYLPVHVVFKEASLTTKIRAVFDASAKTSTGISLNDTLEAGPNLYSLLPDILIKFRTHRIALSANISKMFRKILLQPHKRDLH